MKIAVVSQQNSIGSSTFCVLLSTVFAKTQFRHAAVLSTKGIESILTMCNIHDTKAITKSFNVYQAMLETNSIRGEELYDYGYRLGKVDAFAFDYFGRNTSSNSADVFLSTMRAVPAEMVLVEITGDINSKFNKQIIANVDVVLYLFDSSLSSAAGLKKFNEDMPSQIIARTGYILMKYDRDTLSEKRIAAEAGITVRSMMQFPYNPVVIREGFNGNLTSLTDKVASGASEVLNLRPKLLEIMQFLYDSGKVHYIRGFDKWGR